MAVKDSLEAFRGQHVPRRAAEDCRRNILPNGVQYCTEDGKVDGSTRDLAGSVTRDGLKTLGTPGALLFVPEGAGSIVVVRPEHELDGLGKPMHGHHGAIVTPEVDAQRLCRNLGPGLAVVFGVHELLGFLLFVDHERDEHYA